MPFSNLCNGPPGLMILAGIAAAALIASLTVVGRRRAKSRRQSKTAARHLLMEVRRACVLPKDVMPLNQVPLTIKRIRLIAQRAGFQLNDIGTSDKQLEKFLMIAKDGQISDRGVRPGGPPSTDAWLSIHKAVQSRRPQVIELPPENGGDVVRAAPQEECLAERPEARFQNDRWLDFDAGQQELGDEIIIEVGEADEGTAVESTAVAAALDSGGRWFSEQDLGGESVPDIDKMFDRITMSDEEARANPAKAITIRVDGKKFGF